MHWLDSAPSREIDPVLDCLTFLARRADRPSSPVLLRAGLALSDTGTLPFHQIEPALDQVGMRGEPVRRRLTGWRLQQLPAIVELTKTARSSCSKLKPAKRWSMRPAPPSRCGSRSRSRGRPSPATPSRSSPTRPGARWRAAVGQGPPHTLVLVRSVEGPQGILAGPARRADRQPAGPGGAAVHDERL